MEQWGIMALPMQYERERRWINLYRQHDILRSLTDDEYDRLISYVDSATNLVLDVMVKEKAATAQPEPEPAKKQARRKPPKVDVEAVKPKPKARKKKSGLKAATGK